MSANSLSLVTSIKEGIQHCTRRIVWRKHWLRMRGSRGRLKDTKSSSHCFTQNSTNNSRMKWSSIEVYVDLMIGHHDTFDTFLSSASLVINFGVISWFFAIKINFFFRSKSILFAIKTNSICERGRKKKKREELCQCHWKEELFLEPEGRESLIFWCKWFAFFIHVNVVHKKILPSLNSSSN